VTIWADADSLPAPVREILARRARPAGRTGPDGSGTAEASTGVRVVFAAGRPIPVPRGSEFLLVETGGPDAVDARIEVLAAPGDLVVTRDIPFAARLAEAGLAVINDRGDEWTADTVRERLSRRDFMAGLRSSGLAEMNRARTWGPREKKAFADTLDRVVRRIQATGPRSQDPGLASDVGGGAGRSAADGSVPGS